MDMENNSLGLNKHLVLRPRRKIHEDEKRCHHYEIMVSIEGSGQSCSRQRSHPYREDWSYEWQEQGHQQ